MNIHELLPESLVGTVSAVVPIHAGLSGASVHAVTASRGEFILRVQGARADRDWARQLLVHRRAAEAGIAPAIVHVDDVVGAVLSARVRGVSLPVALGDPTSRDAALVGTVAQLRALHALDTSGVAPADAAAFAAGALERQLARGALPGWAVTGRDVVERARETLDRDPRRVVSHNDANPGNVLWDGARAWLVDWEVAGLGHPYYDLAAFTTFLAMDMATAGRFLAVQEQEPVDAVAFETLATLRRLVAIAAGCSFLELAPASPAHAAVALEDVETLAQCFARRRAGQLDMRAAEGQRAIGYALLRAALEPA